jgi:hypothetical protein
MGSRAATRQLHQKQSPLQGQTPGGFAGPPETAPLAGQSRKVPSGLEYRSCERHPSGPLRERLLPITLRRQVRDSPQGLSHRNDPLRDRFRLWKSYLSEVLPIEVHSANCDSCEQQTAGVQPERESSPCGGYLLAEDRKRDPDNQAQHPLRSTMPGAVDSSPKSPCGPISRWSTPTDRLSTTTAQSVVIALMNPSLRPTHRQSKRLAWTRLPTARRGTGEGSPPRDPANTRLTGRPAA